MLVEACQTEAGRVEGWMVLKGREKIEDDFL